MASGIADVRFVMDSTLREALYIDGVLRTNEDFYQQIAASVLAANLAGRVARITEVTLASDFNDRFPQSYNELIEYVETETPAR
jgi:hypothetical protein